MLFASRSRVVSDFCICRLWHLLSEHRAGSAVSDGKSKAWLPVVHIPAHHVPLHLLVAPLLCCFKLGHLQVLHALLPTSPKWSSSPASSHSCPHNVSVSCSCLPWGQPVSSTAMCPQDSSMQVLTCWLECTDLLAAQAEMSDDCFHHESLHANFGFFSMFNHWFSEAL